jgi:hypothetical protein
LIVYILLIFIIELKKRTIDWRFNTKYKIKYHIINLLNNYIFTSNNNINYKLFLSNVIDDLIYLTEELDKYFKDYKLLQHKIIKNLYNHNIYIELNEILFQYDLLIGNIINLIELILNFINSKLNNFELNLLSIEILDKFTISLNLILFKFNIKNLTVEYPKLKNLNKFQFIHQKVLFIFFNLYNNNLFIKSLFKDNNFKINKIKEIIEQIDLTENYKKLFQFFIDKLIIYEEQLNLIKEIEIPEKFQDPLLSTLIEIPLLLPNTNIFMDKSSICRCLLDNLENPFSREYLTNEILFNYNEQPEIKKKLEEFLNEILLWKKQNNIYKVLPPGDNEL